MFPHELNFLGLQPTLWSVCLCTDRYLQRKKKRHPPKHCRRPQFKGAPACTAQSRAGHPALSLLRKTTYGLRIAKVQH